MRWRLLIGGLGLMAASVALPVGASDWLFGPTRIAELSEQIRPGMLLHEVEAVMGGPGEPEITTQFAVHTGPLDFWRRNDRFKRRWEDPFFAVDVLFRGPREAVPVSHVERQRKLPADAVRPLVTGLLLVAAFLTGLGMAIRGFGPPVGAVAARL